LHAVQLLKVPAMNGAVLAVTIFSQIQVVLSYILLAATIFRDVHQDCQGVAGF